MNTELKKTLSLRSQDNIANLAAFKEMADSDILLLQHRAAESPHPPVG